MSFTFPTTLFANASVLSTQALSIATSTSLSARVLPPGDLYPPQPPGTGPGKRGLIYNNETEVGWDTYFSMVKDVTYGSNGDVIRGDQLQVGYNYVPTVKVDTDLNNDEWNFTTPVLIEGGVKALFA